MVTTMKSDAENDDDGDDDDDDDYEPFFRTRHIVDESAEGGGYWVLYDNLNRTWFRICVDCNRKVNQPNGTLCTFHQNKRKKVWKPRKEKKPSNPNPNSKTKKSNTRKKQQEQQTDVDVMEVDPIVDNDQVGTWSQPSNEPTGMIISISSSLTKKQISQVKQFIEKFHTNSTSIQLTCESQLYHIDETTTHVISDDDGSFTCSLSKQIVQACVHHIFIGSIQWIVCSLEQSSLLDHFPFEILRTCQSPLNSRGIKQCRFDQLPVFPSSYMISIECQSGIRKLKMSRDELIDIVDLSGATLVDNRHRSSTLIILCNRKKEMVNIQQQFKKDQTTTTNMVHFCRPEFLFDSIVRHEVQSIEKYIW